MTKSEPIQWCSSIFAGTQKGIPANNGLGCSAFCQALYLAVPEDGEQERKTLVNELRRVVVRPDVEEVLEQLVDDVVQPVLMRGGQGVHPAVQRPRHSEAPQVQCYFCNVQMIINVREIDTLKLMAKDHVFLSLPR
jgi:hypothetical protein